MFRKNNHIVNTSNFFTVSILIFYELYRKVYKNPKFPAPVSINGFLEGLKPSLNQFLIRLDSHFKFSFVAAGSSHPLNTLLLPAPESQDMW